MNIKPSKLRYWKNIFEDIEKHFDDKLEEELTGIVTNIETYRRIEGLTFSIEEHNNKAKVYMDMRNTARRGINDIEKELLKDIEESYR